MQSKFNIILVFSIILGIFGSITQAVFGQSWISTSGHAIGSDDAYISFRYAENLFNGNGLVFNVGERVEGYSNFLYTLLITPGFFLGKSYIYPLSVGINCIFLAASIYLFFNFCRKNLGFYAANLGAILLAINPWIWANVATGLETTLMLFATQGLWISTEIYNKEESKQSIIALLFFSVICIFSRVDGFIVPIIAAIYLFTKNKEKGTIQVVSFVAICMALYTAFRFSYYDDVIANTFYNKVSGGLVDRFSRGLAFLQNNMFKTGLAVALFTLYFHLLKKSPPESLLERINFPALFLVTWIFYLAYIGGDIYYERFIVPIIPFIIYISLSNSDRFKKQHLYLVFATLFLAPIYYATKDGRFNWASPKYDMWITLGKHLAEAPKGSTLAIDAAGKVPFFSELPTIDMLGLNDKHIGKMASTTTGIPGHEKYDPEYILSKKPTYIAAWITSNIDMTWGLDKEKYLEYYNLKYLVNSSRDDLKTRNIIDVSKSEILDIQNLIRGGHNYGVLVRKDDLNDAGTLSLYLKELSLEVKYHHNSNEILFSGWSYPEAQHRWSSGFSSRIIFTVDSNYKNIRKVLLKFSTLGKQNIDISINGFHTYTGTFDGGTKNVVIPIPSLGLREGINTLEFTMPDARQPDNGDRRVLALALESFEFR